LKRKAFGEPDKSLYVPGVKTRVSPSKMVLRPNLRHRPGAA
jgi:hypothetical protein